MLFSKPETKIVNNYKLIIGNDFCITKALDALIKEYKVELRKYNREEDEDMILFQYGVYDWGTGKHLEFDFTRQLIKKEDIKQIHITLRFNYRDEFNDISSVTHWYSPNQPLEQWKDAILIDPIINKLKYDCPDSYEILVDNAE